MKLLKYFCVVALSVASVTASWGQKTYNDMQMLTVNENVTTLITASEPVRFVDISTDKVVGDQPIKNTIRLKPKEGVDVNRDGDVLAVVTLVTERYRTQYALIYTSRMDEAVTDKTKILIMPFPNNPTGAVYPKFLKHSKIDIFVVGAGFNLL